VGNLSWTGIFQIVCSTMKNNSIWRLVHRWFQTISHLFSCSTGKWFYYDQLADPFATRICFFMGSPINTVVWGFFVYHLVVYHLVYHVVIILLSIILLSIILSVMLLPCFLPGYSVQFVEHKTC
jgi:hypothetical protein